MNIFRNLHDGWTFHGLYENSLIPLFEANSTTSQAIIIYCLGPAKKELEPNVAHEYYIACGNALISFLRYLDGRQCSFTQQFHLIMWKYICIMESAFYELHRFREVHGKFGELPLPAFMVAFSPLLILIVALSALNYIVMGRVMKKADEGSTLYHRVEIGCDFVLVLMAVVPASDFQVIASSLYYAFTGK